MRTEQPKTILPQGLYEQPDYWISEDAPDLRCCKDDHALCTAGLSIKLNTEKDGESLPPLGTGHGQNLELMGRSC